MIWFRDRIRRKRTIFISSHPITYVFIFISFSLSLSLFFVTMILPFTLEGDRWRVAGTFDTGTLQQELDRPSCKRSSLSCSDFSALSKSYCITLSCPWFFVLSFLFEPYSFPFILLTNFWVFFKLIYLAPFYFQFDFFTSKLADKFNAASEDQCGFALNRLSLDRALA